ncbi:MAG: PASTA domain-containing protein [Porphyromonas sp.]|nr:PASTA domain-containing protein [Porphyromonas sp.]
MKEGAHRVEGEQQLTKKNKKMKSWQIILLNIIAMGVVAVVLVWLVLGWLGRYTRHDQVLRVPDIKGLAQIDAREELERMGLHIEVTDSVYDASQVPGVVLESTPKAGATIKRDRVVYVTVNNTEVKQYAMPEVQDQSLRQAEALLKANGFVNITIKYVPGQFDDLALHVKDRYGHIIMMGQRVPYNEPLTLEIASRELLDQELMNGDAEVLQEAAPQPATNEPEPNNDGEDWF